MTPPFWIFTNSWKKNQVESSMKPNSAILNKIQSMGIYVINRDKMLKLLNESFPEANDFGIEVIPGAISIGMKVRS